MNLSLNVEVSDNALKSIQPILDQRGITIEQFISNRIGFVISSHDKRGQVIVDGVLLKKLKAAPQEIQDAVAAVVISEVPKIQSVESAEVSPPSLFSKAISGIKSLFS